MEDLSAAVDVYSDWVDACDAVAKDTAQSLEEGGGSSVSRAQRYRDSPGAPENPIRSDDGPLNADEDY